MMKYTRLRSYIIAQIHFLGGTHMPNLKDVLKDNRFLTTTIFIAVNATLLYVIFFIIKNFNYIAGKFFLWFGDVLSMLSPLFIGLVLAYLFSPLVSILDKKILTKLVFKLPKDPMKKEKAQKILHLISILLTFLIIIAAIFLIIYAFAVLIVGQFVFSGMSSMLDKITEYFITYEDMIKNWASNLPSGLMADKIQNVLNVVIDWFSNNFSASAIFDFVAGISGSIVNLGIGTIISIYLLNDRDKFKGMCRKFLHLVLPQKANAILTETLNDVNLVLSQFIRGALLDAMIIAILSSIGLTLIGLDFSVFIGCFAGIANVIPYFGPILGMVPAFLVGSFTEGLMHGVMAVVVLLIVQQIDCNIIYPKIVGSTTGLHPLFVLLSVIIAGHYAGIMGMIIAVPIAGILQIFILKWVKYMELKKIYQ